eukprot:403343729
MACFGGPAYQDIAIDSQLFLPIQMRLAGRNLTFLTTNDRIYDQIVPPKNQQQEEEKKQQNPVEQQKIQQMQKQLELQAEKMKQEIVAKEQKLDDSRKEIKHLNNQIELLNELNLMSNLIATQPQHQQHPQQTHTHQSNNSSHQQTNSNQKSQNHGFPTNLPFQKPQQINQQPINQMSGNNPNNMHNQNINNNNNPIVASIDLQSQANNDIYIQSSPHYNRSIFDVNQSNSSMNMISQQQSHANQNWNYPSNLSQQNMQTNSQQQQQQPQQQQFHQVIDQMSALFEMFAQYFDRRFFELQEFIYHFNKTVLSSNKNYNFIAQSVTSLKNANIMEILQPFRQKKEDRRLSDELRDHIKQIYDIREDLMRMSVGANQSNLLSTSGNTAQNLNGNNNYNTVGNNVSHNVNMSLTSQQLVQNMNNINLNTNQSLDKMGNIINNNSSIGSSNLTTQLQTNRSQQQQQLQMSEGTTRQSEHSPLRNNEQNNLYSQSPLQIYTQNMTQDDLVEPISHTLPLQQQSKPTKIIQHPFRKQKPASKEESEVQDDSDQELRKQIFTGSLINVNNNYIQQQRPATTMATITTFADDEEEVDGEIVLMGEDDIQANLHLQTSPLQTEPFHRTGTSLGGLSVSNDQIKKAKARSPPQKSQPTKIQNHNKHKIQKKSPMSRAAQGAQLKMNQSSRIPSDQLNQHESDWISNHNESNQMSMTLVKESSKSPFNYTQKQSTSQTRYNEIQSQKSSFSQKTTNNKSTSNLNKTSSTSHHSTKSKTSRALNYTQQQNFISQSTNNVNSSSTSSAQNRQKSKSPTPSILNLKEPTNNQIIQMIAKDSGNQSAQNQSIQILSNTNKNLNLLNFQSSRNTVAIQQHNSLTEQTQLNKLQSYSSAQANSNYNTSKQQQQQQQLLSKNGNAQPQHQLVNKPQILSSNDKTVPSIQTTDFTIEGNLNIPALQSSSGGSSSKHHFESIQNTNQKKNQHSSQQNSINRHSQSSNKQSQSNYRSQNKRDGQQNSNIQIINSENDNSPYLSHKSSILSDEEKVVEKNIKNLDTANKSQGIDNSQSSPQQVNLSLSSHKPFNLDDENSISSIMFEKNLEKINQKYNQRIFGETGGQFDDQFNAHRLTLQGDQVSQSIENLPRRMEELQESARRSLNQNISILLNEQSMRHSEIKDISSNRQSLQSQHQPTPLISIMDADNLFGPTANQYPDFDLSQYNSPSFAAGTHIGNNPLLAQAALQAHRQSTQNQQFGALSTTYDLTGSYRQQTSSSSSRESDYLLIPEQKIILHNSVRQKTMRTGFLKLPGPILALLGDFLNEKLPLFIFTNRISFKVSLQYQIEHYEHQRQIILSQVYSIYRELERMQNTSKFDLSPQSQEEYEALKHKDWEELILVCKKHGNKQEQILRQKNIIILRLYLTFMGLDLAEELDDFVFLDQSADFMKDCGSQISEVMDPERSFIISDENKKRIKELLVNLQKEKLIEDESRSDVGDVSMSQETLNGQNNGAKILETFTNLLFEALQFVNIIPNVLVQDMKSEMDELKKVSEAFNGIKNNLIDFKNLVA